MIAAAYMMTRAGTYAEWDCSKSRPTRIVNEVNEQGDDALCEIKLAANCNTETIQEINTKTISIITELTAKVAKSKLQSLPSQQKTNTAQQALWLKS